MSFFLQQELEIVSKLLRMLKGQQSQTYMQTVGGKTGLIEGETICCISGSSVMVVH